MRSNKLPLSEYFIPSSMFDTCLLDGKSRDYISELYQSRKNGAYYLDKFANYLRDKFKITLKDYCKNVLNIKWPVCPTKGIETGYKIGGAGIKLSQFTQGGINQKNCPKFKLSCDKASVDRLGKGNPMFGKAAWNKGLDNSDPRVLKISQQSLGRKASPETIQKLREAGLRREVPGNLGKKHTPEAKEKMRIATASRYQNGFFRKPSKIHLKVKAFLDSLSIVYSEEHHLVYYSLDFGFPELKICIEVQGSYFHVDPRIYPNGPIDKIQRRNYGRDIAKRKFLSSLGWKIIEVWEPEVNDGQFKDQLLCKFKELNISKELGLDPQLI